MTKKDKIKNFDINGIGDTTAGMFGLPFSLEECETVLIPVPWEVTVSYGGGTANGPKAIHEASYQVDLYDPLVKDAWQMGIGMDKENRLSRLSWWVVKLSQQQQPFALKLPNQTIAVASGQAHQEICLTALALFEDAV